MSSNSSSSDDEYKKIREAVDEDFLTEDLFTEGKSKKKSESQSKPQSLRNQSHQEVSNNPFSVKVTPEFQNHVSKHLSRLLDEIIDDRDIITNNRKLKKRHLKSGVKLLGSSKDYILCDSGDKIGMKSIFPVNHDVDIDYEKRAKEVAVTPEWVLSQEETKHWAPYTKGAIEIIKLDDKNKNFKHSKKKKKVPTA